MTQNVYGLRENMKEVDFPPTDKLGYSAIKRKELKFFSALIIKTKDGY